MTNPTEMRNQYFDDGVPGYGQIQSDGSCWTAIGEAERRLIERRGMKSKEGKECLGIKNFGSGLYALWPHWP